MKKKPKQPASFPHRFTEGLRERLDALKTKAGHTTLTSLMNSVLAAWAEKEERKAKQQ